MSIGNSMTCSISRERETPSKRNRTLTAFDFDGKKGVLRGDNRHIWDINIVKTNS